MERVETTAGSYASCPSHLPRDAKVPFSLINRQLTKKEITEVIDVVYRHCGQKTYGSVRRRHHGRRLSSVRVNAGISFGKDDMIIPDCQGNTLVEETRAMVKEFEEQYQDGLITQR